MIRTTQSTMIESERIIEPCTPFSDILRPHSKDLFGLVCELNAENISQLSINLLIKISYELARFNVRNKIGKIASINKRWELSVEDIAIESISKLFVWNSKRNMLNLKCFLVNWSDPITDSTGALFFLNKIVTIRVEQYLNQLFRETDPFFARMLDTLFSAIKKLGFHKIDHFGSIYIVKDGAASISGKLISYEDFMHIPLAYKSRKREMISGLMDYLENKTDFCPAIPLNPLVERLMGYNQYPVDYFTEESPSHFERFSMDDIIYNSLKSTILKMKRTYLKTNKLNRLEAECIASALTDIAFDFREGNTISQLSDYLKVYIRDFTADLYRVKYRNTLEYLVKIFKASIAGRLKL
ncbi:MAG: hypothetical protein ACM3QX_11080 [Syntrophomonadaceae bacterium]